MAVANRNIYQIFGGLSINGFVTKCNVDILFAKVLRHIKFLLKLLYCKPLV